MGVHTPMDGAWFQVELSHRHIGGRRYAGAKIDASVLVHTDM